MADNIERTLDDFAKLLKTIFEEDGDPKGTKFFFFLLESIFCALSNDIQHIPFFTAVNICVEKQNCNLILSITSFLIRLQRVK